MVLSLIGIGVVKVPPLFAGPSLVNQTAFRGGRLQFPIDKRHPRGKRSGSRGTLIKQS